MLVSRNQGGWCAITPNVLYPKSAIGTEALLGCNRELIQSLFFAFIDSTGYWRGSRLSFGNDLHGWLRDKKGPPILLRWVTFINVYCQITKRSKLVEVASYLFYIYHYYRIFVYPYTPVLHWVLPRKQNSNHTEAVFFTNPNFFKFLFSPKWWRLGKGRGCIEVKHDFFKGQ